MKIPEFYVKNGQKTLPYYLKKIRLKNGKYIKVKQPRFSGIKCKLPKHFCDQPFWDYCNEKYKTDMGCEYQKRIAIVKIGRDIQKYPWLKYQIINRWPFIKKRFTKEQLEALKEAANSPFDLNKPISPENIPSSKISIPGHQVNHEPLNGQMRLISEIEHDGVMKNPHVGGMRLNKPEGFTESNFSKQDWEIYNEQNFSWLRILLLQLQIPIENGARYVIASIVKFWRIALIILLLALFLFLLRCVLFHKFNNNDNSSSEPSISYTENVINTDNSTISPFRDQIISNISFFDFGKSSIIDCNEKELDHLIEKCKSDTTLRLIVYGCTCDIGSIEYNQLLSEQRANTVKQLLIQRCSLLNDRVEVIGLGELLPDSMKYTKRELNRRVDIEIKY